MTDGSRGARALAVEVLTKVLDRAHPLDDAFDKQPGLADLSARDRAFARNLATTALRRLGQIDDAIGRCLERPLPDRAARVRQILRLGAAQILFLGTPPHAAVSTAVTLAAAGHDGRYKKLVNGVLRTLDREGRAWVLDQDAARLNTPDWLWESWDGAYGEAAARGIAEAHLAEAPLDLSVAGDAAAWAGRLRAEVLPGGGVRRPAGGPVCDLPGYRSGGWWVQDAAAAMPARLLGEVAGRRVLDLCAAPGGKTAQLAAAGAAVTAVDRSERRLDRLRDNLARLGLAADIVTADAAVWRPEAPVDAALLDAPCSATGTLRRRPDVAWHKSPAEIDKLAGVQDRLLAAAAGMVAPGGLLVYCTCSLQPQEGPDRVDAFLAAHPEWTRRPVTAAEAAAPEAAITPAGDLRTLPFHWAERGGLDGFFAARLRRH